LPSWWCNLPATIHPLDLGWVPAIRSEFVPRWHCHWHWPLDIRHFHFAACRARSLSDSMPNQMKSTFYNFRF